MRQVWSTIVAVAALGCLAPAAGAHTFSGSCHIDAVSHADAPVSPIIPAPAPQAVDMTGRCTGSLDGAPLPAAGAPIASHFRVTELDSCFLFYGPAYTTTLVFDPSSDAPVPLSISLLPQGGTPLLWPFLGRGTQGGLLVGTSQIHGDANALNACLARKSTSATFTSDLRTLLPVRG